MENSANFQCIKRNQSSNSSNFHVNKEKQFVDIDLFCSHQPTQYSDFSKFSANNPFPVSDKLNLITQSKHLSSTERVLSEFFSFDRKNRQKQFNHVASLKTLEPSHRAPRLPDIRSQFVSSLRRNGKLLQSTLLKMEWKKCSRLASFVSLLLTHTLHVSDADS